MIPYAVILMLLSILISLNSLGLSRSSQNISEEINYLFSDLTPDYLGAKEPGSFDQQNSFFNKNEELKFSSTDSIENNKIKDMIENTYFNKNK
jgi:hypothetical protein